jgi:hypothetical protein
MKADLWLRATVAFIAKGVQQPSPLAGLTERLLNRIDHLHECVALGETGQLRRVQWCARFERVGDSIDQREEGSRARTRRHPHR